MSTSHHDNSIQDPQPTSTDLKEEFGFKSQSKTERALKAIQHLSGFTTILSTSQLISMGFSLANDSSSFNILSTSLASASLFLSLALAYWSTKTLKSEQERHLLAQDLNLETFNTGLFVALLMRAALSLVLIPNMLLQSDNVPLPLVELLIFCVFLSASKTIFNHIKQPGQAMSSLIFFANIAMLSSALGLIHSALRLEAFPIQGESSNTDGFLKLGAITSFTSFLVWLVNFKKWRVPSALTTLIVGTLVISFAVLSISGYINSNTSPLNNLGMLTGVFGFLVFIGGSYFFKRHSEYIETNKKRNIAGFTILVSLVLVCVAARGLYWQPFAIQQSTSEFSTLTYDLEDKPQVTELWAWLKDALDSLGENLNNVNQNLANVHSVSMENSKKGSSNTSSITPSEIEAPEQVPELSALWEFFNRTKNSTNTTEHSHHSPQSPHSPKHAPPPPSTTKLWAWLADSLNTIQGHINTIKQIHKNMQDAGFFGPNADEEEEEYEDGEYDEDYEEEEGDSERMTQLWSLWRSVNETQKSINAANETLSKIHQNPQNISAAQTTELWAWLADSLNTIQGHINTIQQIHKNMQDAGFFGPNADEEEEEYEDGEYDEEYEDEEEEGDSERMTQLWSLWSSVNKTQESINSVNQELSKIHQNVSLVNTSAPQTTGLWAWLADSLNTLQGHINTIQQIHKNMQDAGYFGSNTDNEEEEYEDGEYDEEYEDEEEGGDSERMTQLWSLWRSVNKTQASIYSVSQELSKVHQNSQKVSGGKTTELWAWLADSLNTIQGHMNTINQHVNTIKNIHKNMQDLGLFSGSTTPVPASNGDVDDVEDVAEEEYEDDVENVEDEEPTQLFSVIQA